MEKRAFLAVILSLAILILYQQFVARRFGTPPPPEPVKKRATTAIPTPKVQRPVQEPVSAPRPATTKPTPREIKVETDQYIAVFTNRGARLKSLVLRHYRTSVDEQSPPFEMVPPTPGVPYPLGLQLSDPEAFNDRDLIYKVKGINLRLHGEDRGSLTFQGRTPSGVTLIKKFTFSGSSYMIGVEVSTSGANRPTSAGLLLSTGLNGKDRKRDAVFEGLLGLVDGKFIREPAKKLAQGKDLTGKISWAGFGQTYFLSALLPEDEGEQRVTVKPAGPGLLMAMSGRDGLRGSGTLRYQLFIGPKDLDVLKEVGRGLEKSINFGYFAFVSVPLLHILRFSHRFTSSYGIDIILLTLLMKLLLAPLTHKSYVSMKQMQKLQPQMQRIKERFKDDKEKMNKEIMELYRRNKVNPLGGCLPMLLQFPVFIGLYNALRTPIDLRHAPFLWIDDLSRPDWESLPITLWGWRTGIPILVLLMGVSMFVQQWMTPTAGDPNQKRMMYMMPVIFTVMFVNFPSGLTIYWLINNVLTIGQQYIINRVIR